MTNTMTLEEFASRIQEKLKGINTTIKKSETFDIYVMIVSGEDVPLIQINKFYDNYREVPALGINRAVQAAIDNWSGGTRDYKIDIEYLNEKLHLISVGNFNPSDLEGVPMFNIKGINFILAFVEDGIVEALTNNYIESIGWKPEALMEAVSAA